MHLPFLWPSRSFRPMMRVSTNFAAVPRRSFGSTTSRNQKKDHYLTLNLPKNATKGQVKRRFYELSKRYHPDVSANDGEAAQKFLEISEAYNVLGNDFTRRDYDRRTDPAPPGAGPPAGFRRHTSTHARARAANNVADAVHARQAAYDRLRRDREHPAGHWPGRTSVSHGYGPLHGHRPPYRATNQSHSHSATSSTSSTASTPSSAAGATKAKPEELRTFRTGWNPEPHKYSSDREYTVSKERRLLWAIVGFGAIMQGVWLLRLATSR